ncbi:hypothetical protein C0Q70_01815 [Pomacea canaliculata]|uniref:Glucuronosyltransferase n=1 Tax=Pomacea canaliculata TaxID=400727 RepID=A0A2T7Q0M1_POMCA|nr:hypothetical protein C0Q70_01815 [Pomacea canaliculata]
MSSSWTSAVIACGPLLMLLTSLTSLTPGGAEGKRVVMMPNPLTSHTKYHTNVARALHARGHEVWVTMPDYLVRKGQLDVSNFTVIQYSISVNVEEKAMFSSRDSYFNGENEDLLMLIGLINAYCDDMLRNETLFRYLRDVVAPTWWWWTICRRSRCWLYCPTASMFLSPSWAPSTSRWTSAFPSHLPSCPCRSSKSAITTPSSSACSTLCW